MSPSLKHTTRKPIYFYSEVNPGVASRNCCLVWQDIPIATRYYSDNHFLNYGVVWSGEHLNFTAIRDHLTIATQHGTSQTGGG